MYNSGRQYNNNMIRVKVKLHVTNVFSPKIYCYEDNVSSINHLISFLLINSKSS